MFRLAATYLSARYCLTIPPVTASLIPPKAFTVPVCNPPNIKPPNTFVLNCVSFANSPSAPVNIDHTPPNERLPVLKSFFSIYNRSGISIEPSSPLKLLTWLIYYLPSSCPSANPIAAVVRAHLLIPPAILDAAKLLASLLPIFVAYISAN